MPVQKARPRYLAFRVIAEKPVSQLEVFNAILRAVLSLHGEYGLASANIHLIDFDSEKNSGIIKCNHKAVPLLRSSIVTITQIAGKPAIVSATRVSGTVKRLRQKLSTK
ncbi:ribonuclease P [Candidatus Bathyarchaeota archaeon]|nr:ribonuclease P [Candidatus Bathyarchaeota archaeon]